MLRKWLVCSTTLDVSCKIYRHYLQKPGFGICFIQNNWCWQASLRRVADCQWPSWYLADCLFYCLVITFLSISLLGALLSSTPVLLPSHFHSIYFFAHSPLSRHAFFKNSFLSNLFLTRHPSFYFQPSGAAWTGTEHEDIRLHAKTPDTPHFFNSFPSSPKTFFSPLRFTHPNPHNPQTPSTLFVSTCLHSANEWCQLRWKLNKQCILQREITKTCLHLIMVVCWISRLWITSCTCF